MNQDQRKAKWNESRSRGYIPVVSPDVEDCKMTCKDSENCYISGCVQRFERTIDEGPSRRTSQ